MSQNESPASPPRDPAQRMQSLRMLSLQSSEMPSLAPKSKSPHRVLPPIYSSGMSPLSQAALQLRDSPQPEVAARRLSSSSQRIQPATDRQATIHSVDDSGQLELTAASTKSPAGASNSAVGPGEPQVRTMSSQASERDSASNSGELLLGDSSNRGRNDSIGLGDAVDAQTPHGKLSSPKMSVISFIKTRAIPRLKSSASHKLTRDGLRKLGVSVVTKHTSKADANKKALPSRASNAQAQNQFLLGFEDATCILNPNSGFMRFWDGVAVALLVYVAVITPFDVAFLNLDFDALFMLNRFVDLMFMVDVTLNFFIPYFDIETGRWNTRHSGIACHYLKHWFFLDVISIFPFDLIALAAGDQTSASTFRLFRNLRLLRLAKLLRVIRASRILKRWKTRIGINHSVLSLVRFFVVTVLVAHWSACSWFLFSALDPQSDTESWVVEAGVTDRMIGEQYLYSLYWSVTTLTTIGYGDIVAVNNIERLIAIIAMLCGGFIYAYIIGAVYSIVSNLDQATLRYRQDLDNLNMYMREISLPASLRRRLREYFEHTNGLHRQIYYQDLLRHMSPGLQGEVASHMHYDWIQGIHFFNSPDMEERREFVTAIAVILRPEAYAPFESILAAGHLVRKLYIIYKGLASRRGRVLRSGSFFGENMILTNGRNFFGVRSLTFVDCYTLHKDALYAVLDTGDFESTRKKIRREVIRLALQRELTALAAMRRMARLGANETKEFQRAKTRCSLISLDALNGVPHARASGLSNLRSGSEDSDVHTYCATPGPSTTRPGFTSPKWEKTPSLSPTAPVNDEESGTIIRTGSSRRLAAMAAVPEEPSATNTDNSEGRPSDREGKRSAHDQRAADADRAQAGSPSDDLASPLDSNAIRSAGGQVTFLAPRRSSHAARRNSAQPAANSSPDSSAEAPFPSGHGAAGSGSTSSSMDPPSGQLSVDTQAAAGGRSAAASASAQPDQLAASQSASYYQPLTSARQSARWNVSREEEEKTLAIASPQQRSTRPSASQALSAATRRGSAKALSHFGGSLFGNTAAHLGRQGSVASIRPGSPEAQESQLNELTRQLRSLIVIAETASEDAQSARRWSQISTALSAVALLAVIAVLIVLN